MSLSPLPSCPSCTEVPQDLDYNLSAGHITCKNCGLIVQDYIYDEGPEWRTFANDDNNNNNNVDDGSRVGAIGGKLETSIAFPSYHPKTSSSSVRNTSASAGGRAGGLQANKLSRAHNSTTSTKATQNLSIAHNKLHTLASSLLLPNHVVATAKDMYTTHHGSREVKKVAKAFDDDAVVVACIYMACKTSGVGRSVGELCRDLGVGKRGVGRGVLVLGKLGKGKGVGRGCSGDVAVDDGVMSESVALSDAVNIDVNVNMDLDVQGSGVVHISKPSALVERACNKLGWKAVNGMKAWRFTVEVEGRGLGEGRRPANVAAACVIFVGERVGERWCGVKEVAGVMGVGVGSVKGAQKVLSSEGGLDRVARDMGGF